MGEKQGLEIIVEAARSLQSMHELLFVLCGTGSANERLIKLAKDLNNVMFFPLQPIERLNTD